MSAKGLTHPVILQTHVDPVPEFIIKNNLRTMDKNVEDFIEVRPVRIVIIFL